MGYFRLWIQGSPYAYFFGPEGCEIVDGSGHEYMFLGWSGAILSKQAEIVCYRTQNKRGTFGHLPANDAPLGLLDDNFVLQPIAAGAYQSTMIELGDDRLEHLFELPGGQIHYVDYRGGIAAFAVGDAANHELTVMNGRAALHQDKDGELLFVYEGGEAKIIKDGKNAVQLDYDTPPADFRDEQWLLLSANMLYKRLRDLAFEIKISYPHFGMAIRSAGPQL